MNPKRFYDIHIVQYEDETVISAKVRGKPLDLSDRPTAFNVAGELARLSVAVCKHLNMEAYNESKRQTT